MAAPPTDEFESFWVVSEPRLRHAFAAAYGPGRGADAAAEALAWAWEHWARLRDMANPLGYLNAQRARRESVAREPSLIRRAPSLR